MKRYLVICEETCPECKGEKSILLQGLVNWPDDFPQHLSEPETEICDNCKGTGVIRKEVDLAEAINEIYSEAGTMPWDEKERMLIKRPRPPAGDIVKEGTRPVKGPTITNSHIETLRPKGTPALFPAIVRGAKGVWRDIFRIDQTK